MMQLDVIFNSHMVFAAGLPIRIYGTGNGLATVTFAGQTQTVPANGKWQAEFPPMPYGGPYELLFGDRVLTDIYVGEVLLLAGQSNIEFKMSESAAKPEDYRDCGNLRLFCTQRFEVPDPYTPADGWVICQKETVKNWSAIGYFTGRELAKDHAVGLIACYKGASMIQSWVPEGLFRQNGIDLSPEQLHSDLTHQRFCQWNGEGTLYRHTLTQVLPFSVSAVVWYQGESDTTVDSAAVYRQELSLLIGQWRKDFGNGALPFVVVQIADYDKREDEGWKALQQAQLDIPLEGVRTVISADVCETDTIHPPTKDRLSRRIAAALGQ